MKQTLHIVLRAALPALLGALLLCGCERWGVQEPAAVGFTLETAAPTKATPYTGASDNPQNVDLPTSVPMGIVTYVREGNAGNWSLYTSKTVVRADCDAARTGETGDPSGKWIPADRILWPDATKNLRFFGYAPFTDANSDAADDLVSVSAAAAAEPAPVISYTVPTSFDEQIDLLVTAEASSSKVYAGDPPVTQIDVPLSFVHALTGIRFRVPADCKIDEVRIENVYGSGTLAIGGSTLSWTPVTSPLASYSYTGTATADIPLKTDPRDSRYSIVEDEYTLLLLPQVHTAATDDAYISVSFSKLDGSDPRTVTSFLSSGSGTTWTAGHLVVYTVTLAIPDNPEIIFTEFDGMSQEHEEITVIKDWD